MGGIDLNKPFAELTSDAIATLPAQLGVFEVAGDDGVVTRIGYAGGREQFGIRTALERELVAGATMYRIELTHGYMTRWQELLMAHVARTGSLPEQNRDDGRLIGTLSP